MDLFTFFLVVCLIGLYVFSVDRRRRREFSEHLAALTSRIYALEEQMQRAQVRAAEVAPPARADSTLAASQPAPQPATERIVTPPAAPPPLPPRVAPPPVAPINPVTPSQLPPSPPRPAVTAPQITPPESKPAVPPPPLVPSQPSMPAARSAAAASALSTAPFRLNVPMAPAAPPAPRPTAAPMFSSIAKPAPRKRSRSFEEMVGVKLLPILGIAIVVLGVAFLVGSKWGLFPHWLRVLILYVSGAALLWSGIVLERKGRYQTLGRALIGGGWAVGVLVTYAIANVEPLRLLYSKNLDLFLLLAVI